MGSVYCTKCGKPFTYAGDVIEGDDKPFCQCAEKKDFPLYNLSIVSENLWKYCPHCGKELK